MGCLAMFFHLARSAVSSRSQTTTSQAPLSHRRATMLEPMKPAPPVTTIMRGVIFDPLPLRCLRGSFGSSGHLLDGLGRGIAVGEVGQTDFAAPAFDLGGADDLVLGVVRALDQHVGLQPLDQGDGGRVVEGGDAIDAGQTADDGGAAVEVVDGTALAL